jgi:hypothetical protein
MSDHTSARARKYDKQYRKRYHQEHPGWQRENKLRNLGLDAAVIARLTLEGCALCHKAFEKTPHLDHDHKICDRDDHACEKCFRGFLCDVCNTGFIRAIEQRLILRTMVSTTVLSYIDKLRVV